MTHWNGFEMLMARNLPCTWRYVNIIKKIHVMSFNCFSGRTWWFTYKCAFWNSLSCGFIVYRPGSWKFSCTIWAETEFVNPLASICFELLGCNNCNCISPSAGNQSAEESAVYKYCLRIQISLQIWKVFVLGKLKRLDQISKNERNLTHSRWTMWKPNWCEVLGGTHDLLLLGNKWMLSY